MIIIPMGYNEIKNFKYFISNFWTFYNTIIFFFFFRFRKVVTEITYFEQRTF